MTPNGHAFPIPSRFLALALLATVLLAGCDSGSLDPGSVGSDDPPPLAPNVRMQISFDQTDVTFSNTLPPGLVGDVGGGANVQAKGTGEGASHMTEYEKMHEVRSYDKDGYLTASYEYIEGSRPHMNMPGAAYNDFKAGMPYNPNDKNPIVRSELMGGTRKYIRKNGDVDRSYSIDPETFRVDPATLDSLEALSNDTTQTSTRRAAARRALERRSLSLRRMSKHHVAFQKQLRDVGNLASVRQVVDLRYGKPVHLVYKREDGKTSMVETRVYARYSGVPVMYRSVTYQYGSKGGEWSVTSRSETTRENITLRFN